MGKRGPQPKPTALRVFQGQRLERPAGRQDEPKPPACELPNPPEFLQDDGKAAWARMGPVLHAVGCITEADLDLFEQWCAAHDDYHDARKHIAMHGLTLDTEKGMQANPSVRIKFMATGIIIKIGQLFGMGPSSRVGLTAPTQDGGHDDLDNFKRTAVTG